MLYAFALICLILYLLCSLWLIAGTLAQIHLLVKSKRRKSPQPQPATKTILPSVTIQIPVYNEQFVIRQLMEAISKIDYPRNLLEVQVLDDSTDQTTSIVKKEAENLASLGMNIVVLHRDIRTGYKAGALQEALPLCKGEFIAIFDADFIPPRDFLLRILPHFTNEKVGGVQSRWTHSNLDQNSFTKIQAFLLDSHFNLEQNGRAAAGYFLNFNGTAGVWRKACILDAGGWNGDVLTEDLELSYRAQLKGWELRYDNELTVPAELPSDINALKSQQYRWAKGMAETARRHLRTVLNSTFDPAKKSHAFFHLLGSLSFVAVLGNIILTIPIIAGRHFHDSFDSLAQILLITGLTLPLMGFYYYTGTQTTITRKNFWLYFPLFLIVYMALSVQNGIGVLQGLAGKKSAFVRTPKTNGLNKMASVYLRGKWTTLNYIELLVTIYVIVAIALCIIWQDYFLLTFLLMLLTGMLIMLSPGIKSLVQSRANQRILKPQVNTLHSQS